MAEDALDAIAPIEAPAEIVATEPTPEAAAPPAPTPEPPAAEPVALTPVEKPQDHSVPLPKYLDLRDEVKELKRWKAEHEAKVSPQAVPDPIDDHNGYLSHIEGMADQKAVGVMFRMSNAYARREHGEEVVDAALNWAQEKAKNDPTFVQGYMSSDLPVDWIVRQHQRDGLVSQLPTDIKSLDELIDRRIAERGLSVSPAAPVPAVAAVSPVQAPPKSIASDAPSSGPVVADKEDFLAGLLAR